jgi:Thaumatin family
MLVTRRAAIPALPVILSLALSCGGRTGLTETGTRAGPVSPCPEPATAVPDAGSLMLGQGPYTTFELTLRNQCAETIWPAWAHTGGLDQTVPDPSLWSPLSPGESRDVTIHYLVDLEIALWGRTRCRFDEQGQGACETGDCGGFVCQSALGDAPRDATTYDFGIGFATSYNLPMQVTTAGCEDQQCSFDLAACPDSSRVAGACGVAACSDVCPAASGCCHPTSNGCSTHNDVDLTFCP